MCTKLCYTFYIISNHHVYALENRKDSKKIKNKKKNLKEIKINTTKITKIMNEQIKRNRTKKNIHIAALIYIFLLILNTKKTDKFIVNKKKRYKYIFVPIYIYI